MPFVEKYRPDDLESIISHDEIISTIKKFIEGKKMCKTVNEVKSAMKIFIIVIELSGN